MRTIAKPLVELLEREWDSMLFGSQRGLAPALGWTSYHTLRSRGSASGYPDRTLWRDRTVFAELKRELTGKKSEDLNRRPKPAQVRILDGLVRAGCEAYVWRPSDLDDVGLILGKRWRFYRYVSGSVSFDKPPFLAIPAADGSPVAGTVWTPASMWVVGGRRDEAWDEARLPEFAA